jgi:hypothetical protein
VVDEAFEALACALTSHAELGTDHAPGQAGTVGSEGSGLNPALCFPPSRRSCTQFGQRGGVSDRVGVVGVVVEGRDYGLDVGVAEVSWVLLGFYGWPPRSA